MPFRPSLSRWGGYRRATTVSHALGSCLSPYLSALRRLKRWTPGSLTYSAGSKTLVLQGPRRPKIYNNGCPQKGSWNLWDDKKGMFGLIWARFHPFGPSCFGPKESPNGCNEARAGQGGDQKIKNPKKKPDILGSFFDPSELCPLGARARTDQNGIKEAAKG